MKVHFQGTINPNEDRRGERGTLRGASAGRGEPQRTLKANWAYRRPLIWNWVDSGLAADRCLPRKQTN